jgi:hypothetical protein
MRIVPDARRFGFAVTIAGFVGAGFRSSLAGGCATLSAASFPLPGEADRFPNSAAVSANLGRRLLFVVTTAGPASGAACCFRGGRL